MRKRILSILLCLVMVVGLFPTMAFAADGSGATTGRGTKSDPYCVSTYAEMKRLLQTPASYYIKVVGMDNNATNDDTPVRILYGETDYNPMEAAISIPRYAHHHLEIATNIWFVADPTKKENGSIKNIFARLIDVESGSSLEVTGTGSLRVEVNALTARNVIIDNWGGELTIDGSVTLNGIQDFTTNVATRPIWIDGGVTNIKGGYIYGHNSVTTINYGGSSAIRFGETLAEGTALNISGGTIKQVNNSTNQGNENSCALYVDNDKVANAIHLTGGIFEGGMKMKTDKPLSNLLSAGYQFYDMSANAFFDGSVSKTQKKLTVTPTGVNPTVIDKVTLSVKPKAERTKLEDFMYTAYTPYTKLKNPSYQVYEGLNKTGGTLSTEYDASKDYSAIYQFKTESGYVVAKSITAADVTLTSGDGQIWKINRYDENTLLVYVNFPSNRVKEVSMTMKSKGDFKAIEDLKCQSFVPTDKLELVNQMFFAGLKDTSNEHQIEDLKTAYQPAADYTGVYVFKLKPGFSFAQDITDLAKKHVTISEGEIYNVDNTMKNKDGAMLLRVFVSFEGTGSSISNVHLNFKPVGVRHQIADMRPVNWTPGEETLKLDNVCYYDGADTDDNAHKLTNIEAAYDRNKAYSVSFQLIGEMGAVFADGFDKNSITLSDGKVWKVQRIDKNKMVICVTFPASGDTATKINAINLTIKPYDQRHALADFVPTAITPEGMSVTSTNIYKDGTLYTGSYDANTAYSVGYSLNTKSGYAFENGFEKENVTVSNGTVQSVNVINNNYVIVYVDFPKDPTTDPNYVTEAAVQIAAPVAGEKPKGTVDIPVLGDNKDKVKKATMWWSGMLSGNTAFVAGQEYTAIVVLEPKEGVTFADDMKLNVNGKVVDLLSKDPTDGSVQFKIMFTATGSTHTHSYGTDWKYDDTNHWHECECGDKADIAAHSASEWIVDTAATETADGAKHKECTVCKKVLETATIPATGSTHTHSYGTEWKYDDTNHWHECECGDKADIAAHSASEWIVDTAATKTADGAKHKECTVCKKVLETATIPATGSGSTGGGGGGSSVTTYAITVKSAKNGDVTASRKSASKGTTVTLTVDPDKGYVLDTLTVLDSKDKEIKLTEKNSKYTFTMPDSKVTVEATFKASAPTGKNPFIDVPAGSYYEDAVVWAVEKGITSSTSAVTFDPNGNCTRAQAVTFLWRAAGSPAPKTKVMPFADVKAGSYYYDAVLWAVEQGITKGTGDTMFSPDATCTRAQIVTFLWRANGSPAVSGNSAFTDVASDAYYAAAVTWAEKNDVTGGIGGGLFGSNNNCTRAQIVTFLYRAMK